MSDWTNEGEKQYSGMSELKVELWTRRTVPAVCQFVENSACWATHLCILQHPATQLAKHANSKDTETLTNNIQTIFKQYLNNI